ncbi:MAG TPA: YbhB/YbcL family Raf kinase inhibitor-like protein [Gemmataceae bacterium]|nr:YbhB/YbcL family Raf kinase inhibitor-like protein [Gemmataceae bacterium]
MRRPLPVLAVALSLLAGCTGGGTPPMKLTVTSTAFEEGQTIPDRYKYKEGKSVSPPLQWGDPPPATRSFVVICDDPDAPRKTWVHWVLFNLPADTRSLAEGVPPEKSLPSGACQGTNDFGEIGYGGPAPPPGKPHRYYFKVYALDTMLDLKPGATRQQVEKAMKEHVLAEGQMMGKFSR